MKLVDKIWAPSVDLVTTILALHANVRKKAISWRVYGAQPKFFMLFKLWPIMNLG